MDQEEIWVAQPFGWAHGTFAVPEGETAGPLRLRSGQALPYATPDFLSSLVALANVVRLYGKPHTWPWAVPGPLRSG